MVMPDFWDFSNPESESREEISLPDVGEVSMPGDLIASGVEVTPDSDFNVMGLISWICIGVGILVVIIVLLSTTRRPPRGGNGRHRYRSRPRRSRKKRLLSDKYYRNGRY